MSKRTVVKSFVVVSELVALLVITFFTSCKQAGTTPFQYGTEIDSARYYFHKGWHEIMDNGRWTASELAFRKAVDWDPDWALGKSLLGRISRDVNERERLYEEIQLLYPDIGSDERLLVDVNLLSLEAANNRDRGIKNSQSFNQERRKIAEANFGKFARTYPQDDYFKAEYIEFLHANYGSELALDSLMILATEDQMKLGFYISYSASLNLDLGNIEDAKFLGESLQPLMLDSTYTSYLKFKAELAMAQDSMDIAYAYLKEIVAIDSNHIIAKGMLNRVEGALSLKDSSNASN